RRIVVARRVVALATSPCATGRAVPQARALYGRRALHVTDALHDATLTGWRFQAGAFTTLRVARAFLGADTAAARVSSAAVAWLGTSAQKMCCAVGVLESGI